MSGLPSGQPRVETNRACASTVLWDAIRRACFPRRRSRGFAQRPLPTFGSAVDVVHRRLGKALAGRGADRRFLALEAGEQAAVVPFLEVVERGDLAGEKAAPERTVGDEADPGLAGLRPAERVATGGAVWLPGWAVID